MHKKEKGFSNENLELTDYCWLQVNKDSPGYMFPSSSFTEESVKGIIPAANSFVTRHLAIRLDSVFQTVQLPASVSNLNSGLADMN